MATIRSYPARQRAESGSFGEVASGQRAVYHRLKGSYSPTYLTILSVVQAVAMGDLAQVVAAGYQDFTREQWVLTFNTFGVLIITWNVFSVQSALWSWIPDVRDSAAPFIVGALELYLNHTITVSLSAWLVAVSLVGVAGAAGTLHITWRAGRESEHLELLGWLRVHIRLYVAYLTAGGGFLLALAWVCSADHLNLIARSDDFAGKLALGVALFSTLALGGSAYRKGPESLCFQAGDEWPPPPSTFSPLGEKTSWYGSRCVNGPPSDVPPYRRAGQARQAST